jgi:hypothetical protein
MLSRLPNAARLWLWSMCLFILTLWLGTRHNDFPWYYHPDEPGKVEQVLGIRPLNFHHPMLLLNTTKAAIAIFGVAEDPQAVVVAGRWVSAAFTAAAVVALSLLAYAWRGWHAALLAGLALATHHQLYELSHYMKEDTALLFGMSVTFLGAYLHQQNPGQKTAVLTGIGIGLAFSGKMLGFLALFVAVPVFISTRKQSGWKHVGSAVCCALIVFISTNLQALGDPAAVKESSAREIALATGGQGMTQSIPHGKYWSIFLANTTPVIWLLLLVTLIMAWRRRAKLNTAEWCVIAFPFLMGIALSFFPKENDRYFLPASAIFTVLAALAVGDAARFAGRKRRVAFAVCGGALLLGQFPDWTESRGGLLRYEKAFQVDDTADLLEWLRTNSRPGDIIAKDNRVRLPDNRRRTSEHALLPNKVMSSEYVADLGTIEKLEADGVDFLIVSESTYMRFERVGMRPKAGGERDAERRRAFYAELRRNHEPVWARSRSTVIYLHPGLEVYRLNQAASN